MGCEPGMKGREGLGTLLELQQTHKALSSNPHGRHNEDRLFGLPVGRTGFFFHSEDWLNASFLPAAFPMGNVARLCLADFLFFVQFLKIILDFVLDGLPFV